MACPLGVNFPGSDDYMLRGAGLTGAANHSQGILSLWHQIGATGAQRIFGRDSNLCHIERLAGHQYHMQVVNSTGALIFRFQSAAHSTTAAWFHVLASWDTNFAAGSKVAHMYVNDADETDITLDGSVAFNVDYTGTNWSVGANPAGGADMNGDLADLWFAPGQFLDFSVEANRRKFITAAGGAADLGADGSTPTGTAPIVFLRGPAASFPTNLGTGGDFTVTGTLGEAADHPPCVSGNPWYYRAQQAALAA